MGEEREYTENDTEFPFLHSMIPTELLSLGSAWDDLITNIILDSTKTGSDTDYRFAALFAYLASKRRVYEVDKFMKLWTAVNAVYNFMTEKHYEMMQNDYISLIDDNASNYSRVSLVGNDKVAMGLLMCLLGLSKGKINFNDANTYKKDLVKLSKTGVLELESADAREDFLNKLLSGECDCVIRTISEKYDVTPYGYIAFLLAYHIRCRFFHGSRTMLLLVAHNDYEIKILGTINFVLEHLLDEWIPRILKDEISSEKLKMLNNYVLENCNLNKTRKENLKRIMDDER